jgi:hypothetical protein
MYGNGRDQSFKVGRIPRSRRGLARRVIGLGRGRVVASGIAIVGLVLGIQVAVPQVAQASVSCYGDYCSGKDPQATGCAADAYTFASRFDSNTGALVELRWSPTCKTEWARANSPLSGGWIKAVQSTGYTQWGTIWNGSYSWSRQIYSPSKCVYAQAYFGWGGPTLTTACI